MTSEEILEDLNNFFNGLPSKGEVFIGPEYFLPADEVQVAPLSDPDPDYLINLAKYKLVYKK